jgi:hypothetical protein
MSLLMKLRDKLPWNRNINPLVTPLSEAYSEFWMVEFARGFHKLAEQDDPEAVDMLLALYSQRGIAIPKEWVVSAWLKKQAWDQEKYQSLLAPSRIDDEDFDFYDDEDDEEEDGDDGGKDVASAGPDPDPRPL